MKLDADLARDILLVAEAAPANRDVGVIEIEGHSRDEVFEHVELLTEAGLLESRIQRTSSARTRILFASVDRLTWAGHQFIEQARDEAAWKRAKGVISSKGGAMTIEIIQSVLASLAKQMLGLP